MYLSKHTTAKILIVLLVSLISMSCKKVIDVDLNSASPRIVIEAELTDQTGPCIVKIKQSVNFDELNNFPPVGGASVTISDDSGNGGSFTEIGEGIYASFGIQGIPGRTYTLNVSALGQSYTAKSTMPPPVEITNLSLQKIAFGGDDFKVIVVKFIDPPHTDNYYRFVKARRNVKEKFIFLVDDRGRDGTFINSSLFANKDTLFLGDTMNVMLQCIDKPIYTYFAAARQIANQGGPQNASPTNPPSNFSNGALGYFSAYAVRTKEIVVE